MSLASILSIFSIIPELFGIIDAAVLSIENSLGSIPGVTGAQKLAGATIKVNAAMTAAGADVSALAAIEKIITPMINAAVAVFNSVGLFNKPAAPAA